jgi:hypothetical protein
MRQAEPLLDEEGLRRFVKTVDDLIRSVVIPAYLRIALPFTLRERNDFYRLPAPFHVAERILCGLGALLLGVFIIEAPFIPIWSKEILFPMLIAGLFLPNLRKLLSMRRFERELNDVVVRADREVARIDANLLLDEGVTECELPLLENQQHPETRRQPDHETLKGES